MTKGAKRTMTLILYVSILTQYALSQPTYFRRAAFETDSIIVFFENNFISTDGNKIKTQPNNVQMPFPDFRYLIYGPAFRISVYRKEELMRNGGGFSYSHGYSDVSPEDAPYFNLNTLEYRVTRNSMVQTDWTPVLNTANHIDTTAYVDTFNVHRNRKAVEGRLYYRNGRLLYYENNISIGDTLHLSFRKAQQAPFLNCYFVKKDPLLSAPVCMGTYHNAVKDFPVEKFVQNAYKDYLSRDLSFYQNWPGEPVTQNDKAFEESKIAFFFRPRTDINNSLAFEYRILVNGKGTSWKRSDNIIYASDLKAGTQYQLEVRYTDKPQYVYRYKFYVPANWYQTIWFKITFIILLAIVAVLVFLILKNRRRKRLQQEQINKMRTLSAQLNPHFVFNALGSIQGLLNSGEIESANHYLTGFGKLLRNTLSSTEKNTITLREEMSNIENYIRLEQLRKNFNFIVQVQETINLSEIEILPLLFQPVIENAIKHGPGPEEAFEVTLQINKNKGDLEIFIEDNGVGFDTDKSYDGQGLRLTKARIALFNLTNKTKQIFFRMNSSSNGAAFSFKFINWLIND